MSRDVLFFWKSIAWVVVCYACWLYAWKGYSSYPRFDVWFWGIAGGVDLLHVGYAIGRLLK